MIFSHHLRNTCIILALFTVLSGCGGSGRPQTAQVKGVVTLDGQPLEGVSVLFYPQAGGRSSSAVTDAEGKYSLGYLPDVPGATIGVHNVTLTSATSPAIDDQGKVVTPGVPEKLPQEYVDGSQTREVKPGDNQIDFVIAK